MPLGLASGYIGGWFDNTLMRVMDAILSIPALILALAIAGVLGPGLTNAMIALTIVFIPGFTRLVRAQTLAVREETFIEASQSIGSRPWWMLVRARLAERRVAGHRAGVARARLRAARRGDAELPRRRHPAAEVELGHHAQRRATRRSSSHPWQIVYPGVAIALTVLAFNLLGDGLRDAFSVDTVRRKRKGQRRHHHASSRRRRSRGASATGDGTRASALLVVDGLTVEFETDQGVHRVVEDVSFFVRPGEILGLVGESGSGKTVSSLSILRLIPSPPGRIVGGSIRFDGAISSAPTSRRCAASAAPRSRWCSRTR